MYEPSECDFCLLQAADPAEITWLIAQGANPNFEDPGWRLTPLLFALRDDRLEGLQCLLEHGADPNRTSTRGKRPLCEAVIKGNLPALIALLEAGADPNGTDNLGVTALAWATLLRGRKWIRALSRAGARVTAAVAIARGDRALFLQELHRARNRGEALDVDRLLIWASRAGQEELMTLLLELGADPNAAFPDTPRALVPALEAGSERRVELLFRAGARPDVPGTLHPSAVALAAKHTAPGRTGLLPLLLKHGADINGVGEQWDTALNVATEREDYRMVRWLVQHGAAPPDYGDRGAFALSLALREEDRELVELLLDRGADISGREAVNHNVVPPLRQAIAAGSNELARLLIQRGAVIDLADHCDSEEVTPLVEAARLGNLELVELLLDAGADPDYLDYKEGHTALMWAAGMGHPQVVELLLARGADPTLRTEWDESAATLAFRYGEFELGRRLREAEEQAFAAGCPSSLCADR